MVSGSKKVEPVFLFGKLSYKKLVTVRKVYDSAVVV